MRLSGTLWLGAICLAVPNLAAAAGAPSLASNSTSGSVNATSTSLNSTVSVATGLALPKNGSELYAPKFAAHDPKTPKFINSTQKNVNPLFSAAQGINGQSLPPPTPDRSLGARQTASSVLPVGACAPGTPCVNGACCSEVSPSSNDHRQHLPSYSMYRLTGNQAGFCGYSPEFCGAGNCIS